MLSVNNLHRSDLISASFDVGDGECVAVRGKSGSGKTLLLRAIADLDPNEGDVMLDGQSRSDIPAPQWRRLVSYVPAESGWWARTVGEHFPDWSAIHPLAEAFGLLEFSKDTPVERLSTGERQRFALIRSLLLKPRVLLLDEPTSGLDSDACASVESEIADVLSHGTSVLWVTHDAAQEDRIARRSLKVDHGQVEEVGA